MHPSAQTAGGRRVTRWTRELIIEKILEWEARYGEPPSSADWNPSLARWRAQEWRAERYREGVWPSTNAAKRPFGGSFDAAVRAAGLEPRRPGPRRRAAGSARPQVEPRAPRVGNVPEGERHEGASRLAGETDLEAADRAGAADARVAALERALVVAESRADRAETKLSEARRRARRAGEKGARRVRERVRVARGDARADALERAEALLADAQARVRAADDQAQAAARDAAEARREAVEARSEAAEARRDAAEARREAVEARGQAVASERRARELSALIADGQRRLTGGELAELRTGGPSGPAVLATAIKRLARARAAGDRDGLASALSEVASTAVRWRDRL